MPYDRGVARSCINSRQGKVADVRTEVHRPQARIGLRSASVGAEQTSPGRLAPRQGARVLLMDGTAVESAFAFTFDKSNKTALTGANIIYVPYPALFRECEVKK